MSEMNRIDHYLSTDGIRITVADITDAAREAQEIHHLPSLSAVILGKVLNAAAILAMDFKNHEGVSLKWETNSPLGTIHADAYEGRYVRGFLEHPDDGCVPYAPDREADWISRKGKLFVTRYSLLKMPYVSAVDLSNSDAAACVSDYINSSDQTLSHVELEALIDGEGKIMRMAGFIAQLMPEGDRKLFEELFSRDRKWDLFDESGKENALSTLLHKENYVLIGSAPISFRCTCGEDRIKHSLQGLPQNEQNSLLEDDHIEIECHYCGKKYEISRETLMKWFNEKGGNVQ
ncbi:Hsp33 family molecular chaperone HslO [Dialister sp.]|uniref:Hsp33 family molecular chaperone HslO n=1 Tax=Dialister sp. TaxID=1955814 RepID=UPI003F0E0585